MVNSVRGPYNMPPTDRESDDATYNPMADANMDNDEFSDPDRQPIAARGADSQPMSRNFDGEDDEAARSERTGEVPRGEVKDLMDNHFPGEREVSGYTRGAREYYNQEDDVDRTFEQSGIADEIQDVEQ